ncbi:hypothetical protein J6590_102248, partial [Homalodisca vitripennis]
AKLNKTFKVNGSFETLRSGSLVHLTDLFELNGTRPNDTSLLATATVWLNSQQNASSPVKYICPAPINVIINKN